MTFFWIFFVLIFTYLTALVGNIFEFINPLKLLVERVEQFIGQEFRGIIKYPEKLGYYPAFIFYILFIWIELFGQVTPLKLSFYLLLYSVINFIGAILVGKFNWFYYCEFFNIFFRKTFSKATSYWAFKKKCRSF
jgi:hypothetical protein